MRERADNRRLRRRLVLCGLAFLVLVLFPCAVLVGSVDIPARDVLACVTGGDDVNPVWKIIVMETRLPSAFTSALACSALAVAGLLMQTCFSNPLAGPSIMGVSSGASLGVALVMMSFGGSLGVFGRIATVGGAFAGALAVILVLSLFSSVVRSSELLLIVGILIGYLVSSVISLLNYFSTSEGVHSFVIWGLGSFSGVTSDTLPYLLVPVLVLLCVSGLYVKPMNALLLGFRNAENAGVRTGRVRTSLLLLSGALTAAATAWCGPIGFVGLVVPHIARMLLRSSDHRVLLPATMLCGAILGLFCQIVSVLPSVTSGVIPVNAITPVVGVPVILYVLLNRRRSFYG